MDPNPYWALAHAVGHLTHRRPRWTYDPSLAGAIDQARAGRWADQLTQAVRAHRVDAERSDRTIRALARVGSDEPDAVTVLMHALAPGLWARLSGTSDEYHADALGELAFVISDATHSGDIDQSNLARRLVNRAHNRTRRRYSRRSITHVSPLDPGPLARLYDERQAVAVDPAEVAIARADLASFAHTIEQWIAEGRLSETAWTRYRDYRLRRALGFDTLGDQPTRLAAHRVAARLQRPIERHLTSHAS